MMDAEFQSFSKIHRLNRDIIITEKIDGTNAQIFISDDLSTVLAGSRTKWLTPEADNFGFARWVKEHEEELKQLGPGRHFGEWWGAGIQRRYGLTEKRFSLFNVTRWSNAPRPACVGVVPTLYDGPWHFEILKGGVEYMDFAPHFWLQELAANGSHAAPGFMEPEGIVIFHTASRSLFKATCKNDEQHKGENESR